VLLPDGVADLLMGVGGTPEGVMTACAVRALGGCMQARLAPQGEDEEKALTQAGLNSDRVYDASDLVGADGFLVATGVSGGSLLRRPWEADGQTYTESMIVTGGSVRRVVEAQPLASASSRDDGPAAVQRRDV